MDGSDDLRGLLQPKWFCEDKTETVFERVTKVILILGKKLKKHIN